MKDPKASVTFYEFLGMKVVKKLEFPDNKFDLYFLAYDSPNALSHGNSVFDREGIIELTSVGSLIPSPLPDLAPLNRGDAAFTNSSIRSATTTALRMTPSTRSTTAMLSRTVASDTLALASTISRPPARELRMRATSSRRS